MTHVEAVSPPKTAQPHDRWLDLYSRGWASSEQVKRVAPIGRGLTLRGFQGPLRFPVGFARLDCGALIILTFSLGECNFEFGVSPFPVKRKRYECVTAALSGADQLSNLRTMQQELPTTTRVSAHVGRGGNEGREVGAHQIDLSILQRHVTLFELCPPGSQALYFPAFESKPGFESFLQEIIVPCLLIERDGVAVRRSFFRTHHNTCQRSI